MKTNLIVAAHAALALTSIASCEESKQPEQSVEFETDPALLKASLENPIASCQRERISCRRDADSRDEREACDDALGSCLADAAERALALGEALRSCRDSARECVRDGDGLTSCRAEYRECVEGATGGGIRDGGANGPDQEPSRDGGVEEPSAEGDEADDTRDDADQTSDSDDTQSGDNQDDDGQTDDTQTDDTQTDDTQDRDTQNGDSQNDDSQSDTQSDDAQSDDAQSDDAQSDDAQGDDAAGAQGDDPAVEESDAGTQPARPQPDVTADDDRTSVDGGSAAVDGEPLQCISSMRLCLAREPREAASCAERARSCLDES